MRAHSTAPAAASTRTCRCWWSRSSYLSSIPFISPNGATTTKSCARRTRVRIIPAEVYRNKRASYTVAQSASNPESKLHGHKSAFDPDGPRRAASARGWGGHWGVAGGGRTRRGRPWRMYLLRYALRTAHVARSSSVTRRRPRQLGGARRPSSGASSARAIPTHGLLASAPGWSGRAQGVAGRTTYHVPKYPISVGKIKYP